MSELDAVRSGEHLQDLVKRFGSGSPVDWLDFIVDGQSLGDSFARIGEGTTAGDLVGGLSPGDYEPHQSDLLGELLLEKEPKGTTARHALYVCPECGSTGCGAVTVLIRPQSDRVIWERFRYESDYDEEAWDEESYRAIGPFEFDEAQYREALLNPPKEPAS